MNLDELIQQELGRGITGILPPRSSQARVRDLETILNIVRKINTSLVLSDVLELVLDEAIRITKAERGFLMLADAEGKLEFVVGRNEEGASIHAENFQVSSSVLEDVFTTGESLCIENALNDERFERRQSIMNLELQTILCSPLKTQDDTIGVIYVDSKYIQAIDKADVLNLFEILAGQAAIAIKNARLYQDLKTAYDDIRQANEQIIKFERMAMKGEIAAEVSHELKNLVAVVLLHLQSLHKRIGNISSAEIKTIVDKTMEGTKKIQKFSQNLLTQTRPSANKMQVSPNKLAREFIDFIKVLPKFKRNEIVLTVQEEVPELAMDVDQMQQVLLNLANNAVEEFPEARIEFRTEYDRAKGCVYFYVVDNGPGIDSELREKLLVEKITTKPDGHGYGLPICRQIVEYHGGTMRVESTRGAGASFIMTFPVGRD